MGLEAVLKDLREKYIQDLQGVIESIESFHRQQNLALLREEFHKLRGTGKTYGLEEISAFAEAVENLCVFFPDAAPGLIPYGIKALHKIYSARLNGQEYDLANDTDFAKIQALVRKH